MYRAPGGIAPQGAQFGFDLEREAVNQPYGFNRQRSQSKHGIRDGHAAVTTGGAGVHLCLNQQGVRPGANIDQDEVVTVSTGGVQSQGDLLLSQGATCTCIPAIGKAVGKDVAEVGG